MRWIQFDRLAWPVHWSTVLLKDLTYHSRQHPLCQKACHDEICEGVSLRRLSSLSQQVGLHTFGQSTSCFRYITTFEHSLWLAIQYKNVFLLLHSIMCIRRNVQHKVEVMVFVLQISIHFSEICAKTFPPQRPWPLRFWPQNHSTSYSWRA